MKFVRIDKTKGSGAPSVVSKYAYIIAINDIAYFPAVAENGVNLLGDIVPKENCAMIPFYLTTPSQEFSYESIGDDDEKTYKVKFTGTHPGTELQALEFAKNMIEESFLVLIPSCDLNAPWKLLGEMDNPLIFTSSHKANKEGSKFNFNFEQRIGSEYIYFFYNGVITVPEPSDDELPVNPGTAFDPTKFALADASNIDPFIDLWLAKFNGKSALSTEFTVSKPVGSYDAGETFPAGMTWQEAFKTMLTDKYEPTLIAPIFTLSNNAGTREVGETINLTLTGTLNKGEIRGKIVGGVWQPNSLQNPRSGDAVNYIIGGETISTNALSQTKNYPTYKVLLGANTFSGSVNHGAGPQPKNSEGEDFSSPLAAGKLDATTTFNGGLRTFAGLMTTPPADGAALRAALLSTSILNAGNTFFITTDGVKKNMVVALPGTKTLLSAINDNTRENLTFTEMAINTVPDAGGTPRTYKVYVFSTVQPFPAGNKIIFTTN